MKSWVAVAKTIMNNLQQHPISSPFFEKPELGAMFPEKYFKVVKKPIDLSMITDKLNTGKYSSIEQWQIDVNKVFSNWKRFWKEGFEYEVADEVEAIFENECSKLELLTVSGWMERVVKLRDRIGKLNFTPPSTGAFDLSGIVSQEQLSHNLPSEKEWKALIAAMKDLTEDEDHAVIVKIIQEEEPSIPLKPGDNPIDLLSLKPTTFRKIRDFVTTRLKEGGEK